MVVVKNFEAWIECLSLDLSRKEDLWRVKEQAEVDINEIRKKNFRRNYTQKVKIRRKDSKYIIRVWQKWHSVGWWRW